MNVACDKHNQYPISLDSWPTGFGSTQTTNHGTTETGFRIPNFVTTKNTACPVVDWCISTSSDGSGCTQPTGLSEASSLVNGVRTFKLTSDTFHKSFTNLYVRATALSDNGPGTYNWFGPYTLNVGCFTGGTEYTDNTDTSYLTNVFEVGSSTTDRFEFKPPTVNSPYDGWCTA
jgi:hypothetical protein